MDNPKLVYLSLHFVRVLNEATVRNVRPQNMSILRNPSYLVLVAGGLALGISV